MAGLHIEVGRRHAGRAADAARGMAGGLEAELTRRGAVEQPGLEQAGIDQLHRLNGQAFAIERARAQTPGTMRIVADRHALGEDLLAELVEQEAGLASDRGAGDGAEEMADQPGRDPAIEYHRHRATGDPGGIDPGNGALAGQPADQLGRFETGGVAGRMMRVVALHRATRTGEHAGRGAVAGLGKAAGEAVAGRERHHRARGAGAGAFAVGDAFNGAGGLLGEERAGLERGRIDFGAVIEIEHRRAAVEQAGLGGEAGPFVLGRLARHRDGALDERGERVAAQIGSGDTGRAAADEDAQAKLLALRTLDILEFAHAHRNRLRTVGGEHGIGGVGACGARPGDDIGGAFTGFGNGQHRCDLGMRGRNVKASGQRRSRRRTSAARHCGLRGSGRAR
jgi:hypothetical protein